MNVAEPVESVAVPTGGVAQAARPERIPIEISSIRFIVFSCDHGIRHVYLEVNTVYTRFRNPSTPLANKTLK
jgi:hypothetical protein